MPIQDPLAIKEKILFLLKTHGPSLPVRIARETGLSILFASAFLSELVSEKRIKISHMKVGSSPIYFFPEQESSLENFSQYLKSKEKEAFLLLKEKKFLKDSEQSPAIRVALREIRDFAMPFKKPDTEELFWRYFSVSENEIIEKELKPKIKKQIPAEIHIKPEQEQKELKIFDKKLEAKPKRKKAKTTKKNEKFFNVVREFLSKRSIEILNIEFFSKNELVLKIKENNKEEILIAYNKKRLNEEDIIKAHKKALEAGLKYRILSQGELLERTKKIINALKDIEGIEKMDSF